MAARVLDRGHRALGRESPVADAVLLLLAFFVAGVVVGQALGVIPTPQAAVFLLAPALVAGVALRPAWPLLLLLALPLGVIKFVPTRVLVLLLMATLLAQLVVRGRLFLGPRSGAFPLLALIALALIFRADLGGQAALTARGFLASLVYYTLLLLVAYNATRLGELTGTNLMAALIFGIGATATLEILRAEPLTLAGAGIGATGPLAISRNFAYVAVLGFSLAFARALLRRRTGRLADAGWWNGFLAAILLGMTAIALVRAAWLAGVLAIALVAWWSRRHRYLLIIPALLIVVLMVPAAEERVLPGPGGDVTTGRAGLWTTLWSQEIGPSLPLGQGFGYTWSLTSERLFGFRAFQVEGSPNPFVFPHNDFLFLMLEFGLLGAVLLLLFWGHLIAALGSLSRCHDPDLRRDAVVVSGVLVTMFIVHVVDNGFAIRTVADRFFVVAGFILGLRVLYEQREWPSARRPSMRESRWRLTDA